MNSELTMPTITCLEEEGSGATYAIEPLPAGYGIVLGNPLRRVLLSSLPGAAITAIKIDGVAHEFQDIPHVLEDVTEIVLNIKRIRLRSFADLPVSLLLRVQGTPQGREVTAADIQAPAAIEIVNPAQHIATLDNEQVTLTMELTAEVGRGYRLAPVDPKQAVIGTIDLDALFSPIVHVNFTVEPLPSQGEQHHASFSALERLLLKIVTDGTITPDEALRQAADILVQHYELFTTPSPADSAVDDSAEARQVFIPPELYQLKIDALAQLPRRLQNALRRHVSTVGQLLEMDEKELLGIRNFGKKGLQQLSEVLLKEKMIPILSSHGEVVQPDKTQEQEEGMQIRAEPERQEHQPLKENVQ